ncbi:hypothetical protein [Streptomyces sp. VRA16 Mangrove soil]|uniref:hypothetical protein n=1 Tax=Streptomyces sp. VRA16 Mangrove soil TaxID=2817434 RepID=UPI001A9F74E9|nr:hypothetical protein [Streptomyces sp. VRA16 Mangrove soil]MBO1335109.1 hypothetical protein [Streptomyces sp. VRA16 Mangrove soil]
MKSQLGRVLAGVCAVAALATTAACGSGTDDDSEGGAKKPAAGASAAAKEAELKPLTEAQLKQAVISKEDVKGYRVGTTPDDEIPDVSVPAEPSSCQAIADMMLLGTEPDAKARVSRSLSSLKATDATVIRVGLLAQGEADAKKVVADLRTQSEKCASFEHTDYQYKKVEAHKAPAVGDEAVSYSMTAEIEGEKVPVTYTIVRSGSTLAVFYGANLLSAEQAQVPQGMIEAQAAKLEKYAKS